MTDEDFTRNPPAFQLFASDLLADKRFRLATPPQRGLLLTLWCECWVNSTLPGTAEELARFIGWKIEAFKAAASNDILSFFSIPQTASGAELFCPELEANRNKLIERNKRMRERGTKGAQKRWSKPRKTATEEDYSGDSTSIIDPARTNLNHAAYLTGSC